MVSGICSTRATRATSTTAGSRRRGATWLPRASGCREELDFEHFPAVSRLTVSSQALLRPFETYNAGLTPDEEIRPFNFLLSANVAPFGFPPGVEPEHFHLIRRYERDPDKWLRERWIDRYSDPPQDYPVTTGPAVGGLVKVKLIGDVLAQYARHPEAKSLAPEGSPSAENTAGLLRRRAVRADRFVYVGKETNELDDVEHGLVHDIHDVVTEYGTIEDDWFERFVKAIQISPLGGLHKSVAWTGSRSKRSRRVSNGHDRNCGRVSSAQSLDIPR